MATINISLSDDLRDFVNEQVVASSYTSTSEYLRQLIREHREVVRFRTLIDDGASSPIEGQFDKGYFDDLRSRAKHRTTAT
ncbi:MULTISPECIES: ribbon-helix-helix domain-containing protein [Thiorhodovibrio]|uniref:ribbon-helix-helix domain-containing protein n=1 Tax=Thiorhodovibrio TaxID=61593 RepID=UPI0019119CF6|nr:MULTISPECIES: ribbon-helix-helix domain-containing protein [Thiorhodovibrio]MBK5970802.1 CopG family transcriptional regulator [Thiorhodovibrio winogradskyi]WPL10807.1 Antitoxin ParD4 [Thiorhodovibrio litoralis]